MFDMKQLADAQGNYSNGLDIEHGLESDINFSVAPSIEELLEEQQLNREEFSGRFKYTRGRRVSGDELVTSD